MGIKTKFSDHGLTPGQIVDIASLSQNARYKVFHRSLAGITLANGVSHNLGAMGIKGTVVAAYASNRTVGTYTTATLKLRNLTQTTDITSTLDPSTVATGSANVAFTLSASQPTNALTDALVLVAAGTFTAQPVEMVVTIVVDPSEAASPINQ